MPPPFCGRQGGTTAAHAALKPICTCSASGRLLLAPRAHLAGSCSGQAIPHEQRVQLAGGQAQSCMLLGFMRRCPLKPGMGYGYQVLQLGQVEVKWVVMLEHHHACRQSSNEVEGKCSS